MKLPAIPKLPMPFLQSADKVRDVARVYYEIGATFDADGAVSPTREMYLATAEDAGVPVAVLPTIWQIETRQVALLNGRHPIRIEPLKWKQFGGDPRDLPKPLNPGGATPATTITGQKTRWENFEVLSKIDPIRAIAVSSHGGPQIMGWWAELCGYADEIAFLEAMKAGVGMQCVAMKRFITAPKNAALRLAMQRKDAEAIAHHWNGPKYRDNGYHLKVQAGLRRYV